MKYLSVCSGIEAATVAWHSLGWTPVGFSEIEKSPSRVLAHHYPKVPNYGDFTTIDPAKLGPVDLLVGGTPCQAFSVAGKRLSLADARGNLSLAYTVLAHELVRSNGLRWAVWENVPGVLNTDDNAFGCFLAGLVGADDALRLPNRIERWPDAGMVAGPRARATWRVLDAQYLGLAQRRRRVFVVTSFAAWLDPAAVLFERKSLRRNSASRRQTRKDVAPTISARTKGGVGLGTDTDLDGGLIIGGGPDNGRIAGNVSSKWAKGTGGPAGDECYNLVASYRTSGNCGAWDTGNRVDSLTTGTDPNSHVIAFGSKDSGADALEDIAPTLRAGNHTESHANAGVPPAIAAGVAVRRLTPTECERLQGFPDGYTAIPGAADGPRYKQLGNSMAVPVMRWIGERIAAQEVANDNILAHAATAA